MDANCVENTNCDGGFSESMEPFPDIDDVDAVESFLRQQGSASISSDENGLLMAWNELRISLRQLHKTIVPCTPNNKRQNSAKEKPSVNRIKYLSNMLLNHDPHQLFTKLSQVGHELCLELKVRLLTTVNDSPTDDDSKAFIHGMCESYQWVMSICEAAQSALEKLDSDRLSLFGLNWVSVNMHAFYKTVFTDSDVQDYLSVCSAKLKEVPDNDTLDCLTSLQRTLLVAEELWSRAEINLRRYAQQMASHKRIDDGNCSLENCNSVDVKLTPAVSISTADNSSAQCRCRSCIAEADSKSMSNVLQNKSVEEFKNSTSKPCDCHFCNSANIPASPVIGSSAHGGPIVPISQPQLSLYPHIHGTSSDLVSTQALEDIVSSSAVSNKSPSIPNHLLGTDMITQQLLGEWEVTCGDAISPPSSRPFATVPSFNRNAQTGLVNGLQNLSLDGHPSESVQQGSNVYLANNVSSVIPNSFLTTTVSSHHVSSMTTTSCGFTPISTLNGTEAGAVRDVDHRVMNGNAGVITHTKYSTASNPDCDFRGCIQRSDENSTSGDSSSMCDSSGRDEENISSEGYEPYSSDESSPEHQENHCDCCYCRLLDGQQVGGRQRYNDRRERLLKILARKKATVSSSSSSNTSTALVATSSQTNDQDINQIINYIEGRRESREKKVTKKSRKKKEVFKKMETRHRPIQPKKKSSSNEEEEEEDGPLAELRRGAPDVTITVVKPGDRPPQVDNIPDRSQISISRNQENRNGDSSHPLMVRPQQSNASETWVPPTSRIAAANLGSMGLQDFNFQGEGNFTVDRSTASLLAQNSGTSPQGTTISGLLKNLEPANGNSNKDGSQMVTIKRVMDPITADPTVAITLKGAEKKKDEVLLQLIDGQVPGGSNSQPHEPYNIPKGLSEEEAKRFRNRLRKERKKKKKVIARIQEEEEEKMQQLHIQKQQQMLLQQEKQIKQQQVALKRQQQELIRQQKQKSGSATKGPAKKVGQKNISKPMSVEMSKNYTLPPGVSIDKVAGQPGMVAVSNNLGGPQPFLSNPNVFSNSYGGSYRMPSAPFSPDPMATPYSYGTAWNEANSRKENVIVVDTKGSSSIKDNKTNSSNKKNMKPLPSSKNDVRGNVSNKKVNTVKQDLKSNNLKKTVKVNNLKKDEKATNLKKDAKAINLKKDAKTNALNKEVKTTTIKKEVITNALKKDPKTATLKKDAKVNNLKKDVNLNILKKDVKASPSKKELKPNILKKETKTNILKKDMKVTPLKREAKTNASIKEVKAANSCNKKDVNVQGKKDIAKGKVSPKKKLEDMTTEEKINGALNGSIDPTLLNRMQRKRFKKRISVMEKEAEEQREEDELMDKMYNISLGNKPVKSPAKKVQQVVETIGKKQIKNQSGAVVKRLQKTANQLPKQEAPKVRPKLDLNKESNKNQPKRFEEPKRQVVKEPPVPKKVEGAKQVPKSAQKIVPKVNNKPIAVQVANRKQQAKGQQATEKQERPSSNDSKKMNLPNKHTQKEDAVSNKQKRKASKKNSMDEISDIFDPEYHVDNLDETDREVEAFKRFCFQNPQGNVKQKVEFNVKDIVITRKYGLY